MKFLWILDYKSLEECKQLLVEMICEKLECLKYEIEEYHKQIENTIEDFSIDSWKRINLSKLAGASSRYNDLMVYGQTISNAENMDTLRKLFEMKEVKDAFK